MDDVQYDDDLLASFNKRVRFWNPNLAIRIKTPNRILSTPNLAIRIKTLHDILRV